MLARKDDRYLLVGDAPQKVTSALSEQRPYFRVPQEHTRPADPDMSAAILRLVGLLRVLRAQCIDHAALCIGQLLDLCELGCARHNWHMLEGSASIGEATAKEQQALERLAQSVEHIWATRPLLQMYAARTCMHLYEIAKGRRTKRYPMNEALDPTSILILEARGVLPPGTLDLDLVRIHDQAAR